VAGRARLLIAGVVLVSLNRGAADDSRAAKSKREQRKRRAAGIEQVSALVYMPKFLPWLVREGYLDECDIGHRGKITRALEDYHRDLYWHIGERSDDPEPQYAVGSFGREATALRDQSNYFSTLENGKGAGLLEREGDVWNWRDPPAQYFITIPNAALRQAVTPPSSPCEPATFPVGHFMFCDEDFLASEDEPAAPPDNYDPEDDVEEASADLLDEALSESFDNYGYETD
jgi:hypothetical protein